MSNNHELTQRTRRIETRLTQLMVALGINTNSQKPTFLKGQPRSAAGSTISVPSPHSSLKEILEAIPDNQAGSPVDIYLGPDRVGIITLVRRLDAPAKAR